MIVKGMGPAMSRYGGPFHGQRIVTARAVKTKRCPKAPLRRVRSGGFATTDQAEDGQTGAKQHKRHRLGDGDLEL